MRIQLYQVRVGFDENQPAHDYIVAIVHSEGGVSDLQAAGEAAVDRLMSEPRPPHPPSPQPTLPAPVKSDVKVFSIVRAGEPIVVTKQ